MEKMMQVMTRILQIVIADPSLSIKLRKFEYLARTCAHLVPVKLDQLRLRVIEKRRVGEDSSSHVQNSTGNKRSINHLKILLAHFTHL
jgi:hypothetical protein